MAGANILWPPAEHKNTDWAFTGIWDFILTVKTVQIKELLKQVEVIKISGNMEAAVSHVSYDSKKIHPGGLFVAIAGLKHDGHDFISEAWSRGALCVVGEKKVESLTGEVPAGRIYVQVKRSRKALAHIANRIFEFPSKALTLIGITGTNGKTTTSFLLESILKSSGKSVGVIGTINYRFCGTEEKAPVTTPESLDLQGMLRRMVNAGVTHTVMEVSSHALDLERVSGCNFAAAVFTNLSQDHLDYHENMERYFSCKLRLFCEHLAESESSNPVAIINLDDRYGHEIPKNASFQTITYSYKKKADIFPEEVEIRENGISATLFSPAGPIHINTPLLGILNLYNIMAAVGTAIGLGVPIDVIEKGVSTVSQVSGRLESIPNELGITVIVDYAHTPDAMEKALECVREISQRRVIVVFGCGGDRDKSKRPMMGTIAARYGNLVIVTSDNPRSEDPLDIIHEIESGIRKCGITKMNRTDEHERFSNAYVVEPDRRKAIQFALHCTKAGDLVFIGGKGHEDYQILRDRRIHFDDREEVLAALNNETMRRLDHQQGKVSRAFTVKIQPRE